MDTGIGLDNGEQAEISRRHADLFHFGVDIAENGSLRLADLIAQIVRQFCQIDFDALFVFVINHRENPIGNMAPDIENININNTN